MTPGEGGSRVRSQFQPVALAIVAGFLVLHVGSYTYYSHERMVESARTFATSTAERSLSLVHLLETEPAVAALAQNDYFRLELRDAPLPAPARQWPHTDEVRAAVIGQLTRLGVERADEARLWFTAGRSAPGFVLQYPRGDGWVSVAARTDVAEWGHNVVGIASTTLMVLAVCIGVLLATRRVTRHLPGFARAADAIGRRQGLTLLPEDTGPREIRHASRVLNDMQRRVLGYLEERTTMLAALSHDLRTCVTRLQLRLGTIADPHERDKAQADIRAMTAMLDESLAFARDERSVEPFVDVDLATMIESIVDAARDGGADASYSGPARFVVTGQSHALHRALTNLVQNAIAYGTRADVVLRSSQDTAVVEIRDAGPGIPPGQRAEALKPFVRLETSRSRATGGTGLGLAIAHNVIRRHGGTLEFEGEAGTFRVVVRLGTRTGAS